MDSRRRSRKDAFRASWTRSLSEKFANLLIEQAAQGNRSDNVYNKKAWKYVLNEFNKKTGFEFDRKQLKNHLDVLRKQYTVTRSLLNQSEFRWDESQEMVIADKEAWAKYLEAHPDAVSVKLKGCPLFKLLCMVFSDPGVDGQESIYKIYPAIHQMGEENHFDRDKSKARWTEQLDNLFTGLLVEQVVKGNKTKTTFNKKAWKYIHDEFNRLTGFSFNRKQLRNRYNVLRTLYKNVKSLLDRKGFSWDETNSMVVADDEVWQKHSRGNHVVEAIKVKGCPLYEELRTIFSESESGKYALSSHESDKDEDGTETDCSSECPETANVSAKPVTLSPSPRNEASSHPTEFVNTSDRRNKRSIAKSPATANGKRSCRRENNDVLDGVREMGSTSRSRITTGIVESVDQFSISNCVKVLNELEGIDQNLYLAALDVFEDPIKRETFVSIRSDIRLAWLKVKCDLHI